MKFESRRNMGEPIRFFFMLALLLYTVYLCLFRQSRVWGFAVILGVITALLGALCWFNQTYELADDEMIVHEKKPLKSKRIAYRDVLEYHTVSRWWFGEDRPGRSKDFHLSYRQGSKKKTVILSPGDADDFLEEFHRRCSRLEA